MPEALWRAHAELSDNHGIGHSWLPGGGHMGVLRKLEPATAAKHRLYQRYLDAWWPILLQTAQRTGYSRPRVTLLDAFAGPGRYQDGEPGSPVFILDRLLRHDAVDRMHLSPRRVHLVFIEKDRARHEHLLSELHAHFGPLKDLPVRVEIRRGEAGRDSLSVLDELGAWGNPILGIFDSWGSVNVPLHVMKRIAHNRSSEVITTFGPNWFSRREELNADILDMVFGGRDHWSAAADEITLRRTVARVAAHLPGCTAPGRVRLPAAVRTRPPHRAAPLPRLRHRQHRRSESDEGRHVEGRRPRR
ncbi:three-Cys-motif partner protein TcmP [Streptomyces mirabilis]|uniref:three-Cys-motif partner protein TcmP n=1 Tax=Streptomyces mirabilis TaxID=68239 RepID=UPI00382D0FAC